MCSEILLHFFRLTSCGAAWPLHFKFASYAYAMSYVNGDSAKQNVTW